LFAICQKETQQKKKRTTSNTGKMTSLIIVATPAPTSLPTIYGAGDLLLKNPQLH
jgi:hypothetical protein